MRNLSFLFKCRDKKMHTPKKKREKIILLSLVNSFDPATKVMFSMNYYKRWEKKNYEFQISCFIFSLFLSLHHLTKTNAKMTDKSKWMYFRYFHCFDQNESWRRNTLVLNTRNDNILIISNERNEKQKKKERKMKNKWTSLKLTLPTNSFIWILFFSTVYFVLTNGKFYFYERTKYIDTNVFWKQLIYCFVRNML